MNAPPEGALFPGETVAWGAGFPALARFRRGAPDRPLMLFVPGGGHLARIAYGHPGSHPDDFLLTHLAGAGHSTLALSYPTSHASFDHPVPAMTISDWAESSAAIVADLVDREELGGTVIAIGWSLAGRLARNLNVALRSRGLDLELFVGLSAVPPIPGFGGLAPTHLRLAPSGLLDGSSATSPIFRSREAGLAVVDDLNGRVVIARDVYAHHYVTDSPINFRGEAERYSSSGLVADVGAAVADQGSFDFANYPLCASVAAAGPADARHALTAASAWGMVNARALYARGVEPGLADGPPDLLAAVWARLRELVSSLTTRLSRGVEGSHFFFVGEFGARATSDHIGDLATEGAAIRRELAAIAGQL